MTDFEDSSFIGDEWTTADGIARAFTRLHGEEWRYCSRRQWLGWNGRQWEPDHVMYVQEQIRLLCREAGQKASQPWVRADLRSWRTMNAVEKILRDELSHADSRLGFQSCPHQCLCVPGCNLTSQCKSLGI